MKRVFKSAQILLTALLILAVPVVFSFNNVNSLSMFQKSITVANPLPSVTTSHSFSFNVPSNASVGSIEFEYCLNNAFAGTPCTVPTAINVSGAVIASQVGITGFSVHGSTSANRLVLTKAPSVVGPALAQYQFNNMINPSDAETSIYVRIATFSSIDGTGARVDEGGVVWSTSGGIGAVGFVPPYMTFCVGITVSLNCSSTSGSFIDIGQLNSSSTKSTTTQFAVATNDPDGYNIFTLGTTMTSGTNIINSSSSSQPSITGSSQFGINLKDNSSPDIGAEKAGVGSGNPSANYAIPNQYAYSNGANIASSSLSTEFNLFTVSYIVNVNDTQPAGRYNTTITYLAVASF